MPSLLLDNEQLPVDQFRQMAAGSLRRNIRNHRELPSRQCSAIQKRNQHRGPSRIAEESGDFGELLAHHLSVLQARVGHFDFGRNVM